MLAFIQSEMDFFSTLHAQTSPGKLHEILSIVKNPPTDSTVISNCFPHMTISRQEFEARVGDRREERGGSIV